MPITRAPIPDFTELTEDQILEVAGFLDALLTYPGFDVWQQMLDSFRLGAQEQLSTAEDLSEVKFWQGVVHACKVIKARPAELVERARLIRVEEGQQKSSEEQVHFNRPHVSTDDDMSE